MTALSVCERKHREVRLHARLDLGGVGRQRNCEEENGLCSCPLKWSVESQLPHGSLSCALSSQKLASST